METTGPRRVDGARAPLFERLLAPQTALVYDAAALRQAVRASLARLLSVRAPARAPLAPLGRLTVVDYGVPEPEATAPADETARHALAVGILDAVRVFEPRLQEPAVSVDRHPAHAAHLVVRISGRLWLGAMTEAFAFLAPLGGVAEEAEQDHG